MATDVAVVQAVVDRLKSSHYDLERLCARSFADGEHTEATRLSEAGALVDRAISVLVPAGR